MAKKGKLYAVGVGPGDPELLTLKAVKTIKNADVIAFPADGDKPGVAYTIAEKAVPDIKTKAALPLSFPMSKSGLEKAHQEAINQISDPAAGDHGEADFQKGMDLLFSIQYKKSENGDHGDGG